MRRSKSNPAKYAKNYKVISQRRMTFSHDDADNDERKAQLLLKKQTKSQMQQILEDAAIASDKRKKKTKKIRQENKSLQDLDKNEITKKEELSNETYDEDGIQGDDIILPPRKKKKKSDGEIELTPEELRLAKLQHKNLKRKLKQLSSRSTAKERRKEAYELLAKNSINSDQLALLGSSSNLGKKESKKQLLQKLWRKQQAGLILTEEEKDLLVITKEVDENIDQDKIQNSNNVDTNSKVALNQKKKKKKKSKLLITTKRINVPPTTTHESSKGDSDSNVCDQEKGDEDDDGDEDNESTDDNDSIIESKSKNDSKNSHDEIASDPKNSETNETSKSYKNNENSKVDGQKSNPNPGLTFAQMMMSGLADLKVKSKEKKEELDKAEEEAKIKQEQEEEKNRIKKPRYVPDTPIDIKTVTHSTLNGDKDMIPRNPNIKLKELPIIPRPKDVQELHESNALPIFAMEFEILDAIQSNLVTIVCGETGSGKSTQVPQFLYESGYSSTTKDGNNLLIGMTQPRRVAAISTAKRISYEMSSGNGQTVRPNNLVSYQTRYETAGLGKKTHIKVMTDGILLQEIQSDLLLRKYSVIVLDEAHERNLNTDVLLGLISKAIMLRRQVAKEGSTTLPELKLIIMSATLRVQDFTQNKKLFAGDGEVYMPAVVKVPGRTFPVSIHHTKITELDDYESVALKKICKIHRKLPDGGILVFMTGKQEIDRMVKRLRKCLNQSNQTTNLVKSNIENIKDNYLQHEGPRDMDDDEIDSDMMQGKSDRDDYDELEKDSYVKEIINSSSQPMKSAIILPLHSLLSQEEQAKVFAPVQENYRLIVIATNIAETSITIPNISYVVDTGRQKCLSHHSSTGVKSYDIMWISKASANQRAGRAGRTGPGHCYRLYSSSLFDRQMEEFAIPEVLVRPLEDVVLTMKNMGIQKVLDFPFVTQPDKKQIISALDLLLNIGCLEKVESNKSTDNKITAIGKAVSKLPLGVRYGKMLLIAAKHGILDYSIGLVAILSETSPFVDKFGNEAMKSNAEDEDKNKKLDKIDQNNMMEKERQKQRSKKWFHSGGDVLAAVHALGAYTYAGRRAGGISEAVASKSFCEENNLNFVVMQRIQKLRLQLAKMCQLRMKGMIDVADCITMQTGGVLYSMSPPNVLQETLLRQAIASGLIDNVARLAPHGSADNSSSPYHSRLSYQSCKKAINEKLFINSNSTMFSRDFRRLPEWVCYDSIIRKPTKTGGNIYTMHNITPIDPSWLALLSNKNHDLVSLGDVLNSPSPIYNEKKDAIMCYVKTKYGFHSWEVPPLAVPMKEKSMRNSGVMMDESYRWFARFLLEGKIIKELAGLPSLLNDPPIIITKKKPIKKCVLLVSALSSEDVDSLSSLRKFWAEKDQKFLFRLLKPWVNEDKVKDFKKLWMKVVKTNIEIWKNNSL